MAQAGSAVGIAVRGFQRCWMSRIAPFHSHRPARAVTSLSTVLGGNGGNGACGGGGRGHEDGRPAPGPSDGDGWSRAAALMLAGSVLLCGEGAAWAATSKGVAAPPSPPTEELTVEKVTEVLLSLAGPILTNLGFSGCVGAAAGYALKKVGQVVALCVGLAFLFIQGLAYTGFITVNWSNVHSGVTNALDINKDGKVDADDFRPLVSKGLGALSQGLPSVGGFLMGFMMALRNF